MTISVIDANGFDAADFDGVYAVNDDKEFDRNTWTSSDGQRTVEYNGFGWTVRSEEVLSHASNEQFPPDYDVDAEWIYSSVSG